MGFLTKKLDISVDSFDSIELKTDDCGEFSINPDGYVNINGHTIYLDAGDYFVDAPSFHANPKGLPDIYRECPSCEGGGFEMKCYGGHPIEERCEDCGGLGRVLVEDFKKPKVKISVNGFEFTSNSYNIRCEHKNKREVSLIYSSYWYCPDCKKDVGDVK